jgi:hypothetical protein
MQKKGQLFSLDFIISMVAVTAAIALLLHSIEVNAYSQKEQQLHDELRQVAETAADLLIASNDTSCQIKITGMGAPDRPHLVNCVNENANTNDLKAIVPDGYCYKVSNIVSSTRASYIDKLNYDCGTEYNEEDFYEAKRLVVTNDGEIDKADFEAGNFQSGETIEISVMVWKP